MKDNPLNRFLAFAVLAIVDVALLNIAFVGSYAALRLFGQSVVFGTYLEVAFWLWVLPPLIFHLAGMYNAWDEYSFTKGINNIIAGVAGAMASVLLVIWIIRDRLASIETLERQLGNIDASEITNMLPAWGFPGSVLVLAAVSAPIMIWMWRMAANALERALLGWSAKVRKILIVGQLAEEDVGRLRASHRPPYEIAGHLGKDAYGDQTIPHLGEVADLERVMSELEVDEVFLVAPDLEREEMLDAIAVCHGYRVRIRLVLGIYETLLSAAQTRFRDETPLYSFRQTGITGWTLVIKRLIDVTTASILLLITGILFVLPACVAIVIDSKGWPVFSQTRVGIRGRRFKLYKLRTMVIDADAKGGPLTADNDPRITKVGNFLRKSSIDELPQLWNVIVGDMSMVGPRAVVPYVADQFQEWERVSLAVKPGVTGLAQVSGRDEIAFREKSLLNLYYVRNHSIWLDLRIVFDTIGVVLSMEGTGGTRGAEKKRK